MLFIDWCRVNGDRGKQLLSEWTGLDIYGNTININSVTHGCGIKMQWKCYKCNNIWDATVNNRTATKNSCPMCYEENRGKIASKGKVKQGINDLKTWCLNNEEQGKKILDEWTGKDINDNIIDINFTAYQSNKDMLWICRINSQHRWYTKIQKRTILHSGCPYCANQKILSGENDLETWCKRNNKIYLIEQFGGQLEDGTPVLMKSLTKATHQKVKWRHLTNNNELHEWIAAVSDRTSKNSGCPLCTGMNNLKQGVNDLETWCNNNPIFGKTIREQWTGKDVYGNNINMNEIACKSHTKLFWVCEKCGEYYTQDLLHKIYHKSTLCSKCNVYGTSLPEQIIYRCIKQVYPRTISRGKFQGYEFDITIPELKTCIEYGSYYYHKDKKQRDLEKRLLCEKHNVRFISILDSNGYEIDDAWEKDNIVTNISNDNILNKVVYIVLKNLNINISDIDYNKAFEDAIEFMRY